MPIRDSTIARIAGNLMTGYALIPPGPSRPAPMQIVQTAVWTARLIAAEVARSGPDRDADQLHAAIIATGYADPRPPAQDEPEGTW